MIGKIVGCGVKAVSISLDGAQAATHDGVRGIAGHFDATIARDPRPGPRGPQGSGQYDGDDRPTPGSWPTSPRWRPATGAHIWEVFFLVHVGRGAAAGP